MDYEKKYNEALERARQIKDGKDEWRYSDLAEITPALTEIFPELRESDDERIRKGIVETIKQCPDTFLNPKNRDRMLAYLEKQKEQKPWKVGANAYFTPEQKPVVTHGETYHVDTLGTQQVITGKMPQKPAEWSEVELEFRGEKVKVKRPFYRDDKGRGYSTTEQDEDVAWNALRAWCGKKGISLYDLYPKAEWSEEDADMLNCCISSIEEAKENRYAYKETDGDTSYDREIEWLKSLRPSWKPSEEQMEAFRIYLYNPQYIDNSEDIKIKLVESLYNDLKKLM